MKEPSLEQGTETQPIRTTCSLTISKFSNPRKRHLQSQEGSPEKPPKVETKQEPLPSFLGGTTEVKIEKKDTEPENDLFSGFGGRVRLFYLYIII